MRGLQATFGEWKLIALAYNLNEPGCDLRMHVLAAG